ncbi:50S ribosomal protein L29 [Candidatus Nitrosacidococcus tergens]|uniref:Large ribosomal subunit protein uL29 n=1 Tax=Candidatus Nitrosacidococcus tergens TaxID=553981 RepID=A0A7G1Q861_9GAMM|nr:50S ribosomal protein L29 [Candidatus Nitrosacidococcus tergens]CAB1274823.1 50S ribosomal subunit protein L29 [Candidatus Nitrosacidococcus tergens]
MKAQDLRLKTVDILKNDLLNLLREQFKLRIQNGTNQLSNNSEIKRVRRDIARIKTVLGEKH